MCPHCIIHLRHPGLDPNQGPWLTLDLLCECWVDTWWNLGHKLKRKQSSTFWVGTYQVTCSPPFLLPQRYKSLTIWMD